MLTISQATALLDSASDPAVRNALLAALGFHAPPLTLAADARERLGLPPGVGEASIAGEDGILRALVVTLSDDADVRETISLVARRVGRRVPHLSWLLLATQRQGPAVALGTWPAGATDCRVSALVTARGRIVPSDAETLCALAAATDCTGGEVMRHLRWLDVLGREAIARRFFRALERAVTRLAASLPASVAPDHARELALLTASRLLFLSFLEAKGWLAGDFGFLANGFAACMTSGGAYHRRVLDPLFFGTLNTPYRRRAARARAFGRVPFLNGGLFARSPLERMHRHARLSDDALGDLFGDVLVRHRFTAAEDSGTWSETAIDPEILGKAFECLMAPADRKRHGVHFTPQRFVERLTRMTLASALACEQITAERAEALLDGETGSDIERALLLPRVERVTVLDPACGSGAFLVHVLERLAALRARLGDSRPLSDIRREVLTRCIFGVDVNPTAVWLCELRLWLSAVIDCDEQDSMRIVPLPNLDHNIRVGDSLAGTGFESEPDRPERVRTLRQRYTRAVGRRKATLGAALDRTERESALHALDHRLAVVRTERRELLAAARAADLFAQRHTPDSRVRARLLALRTTYRELATARAALRRGAALPFSYASHFADVAARAGFDVIIGNPPWVRFGNIAPELRDRYRESFRTLSHAAWSDGAEGACASPGFAGQADLAALFVERARDLLAPHGTVGFLLPAKLWRSLAGGGCRRLLAEDMRVIAVEDCSDAPSSFDAAVYPSLLVAHRTRSTDGSSAPLLAVHRRGSVTRWRARWHEVALDSSAGSPWLIVPPEPRAGFERIVRAGTPLALTGFGRPWLGVKSGCNAAFTVHAAFERDGIVHVTSGDSAGEIEAAMLRPLVRGETLTPWRIEPSAERIVWTHDADGPRRALPPLAARWLAPHRRTLERRSDARGASRWWALFRTESADHTRPRVVWSDFGRRPRAAFLPAGDPTVPLNTCYVIAAPSDEDALALVALLDSPLAAAWLSVLAEPARGGYHRFLGWTMARFPLPSDWRRARALLAPLAQRALAGDVPSAHVLQHAAIAAYRLRADCVAPLLEWSEAGA